MLALAAKPISAYLRLTTPSDEAEAELLCLCLRLIFEIQVIGALKDFEDPTRLAL